MRIEHFRKLRELLEIAHSAKPHLFTGDSGPYRTLHADLVVIQLGNVYHIRYVSGPSLESNILYTVGVKMDGDKVLEITLSKNDVPVRYNAEHDTIVEYRGEQVNDRVIELFDRHFTEIK